MANAIRHYLSYQHNVQKYFRDYKDVYDGVLIPLSIAISFPTGTYGFVRALCARDKQKQYAIDPRTPLFQKHWNRAKGVRDPHLKMGEVLGEPFKTKGLTTYIEAADFQDDEVIQRVAKACLEYQQKFRTRDEDARKLAKYKKLLGVVELGHLCEPQFVIPPYFQFSKDNDPWFKVCMRLIDATVALKPSVPVSPIIHYDNWSSITAWAEFAKKLAAKGIGSFWFYPNDFREHTAEQPSLVSYRKAVQDVAATGVKAGALHGGYFAILMSKYGLASFSNGIGYGEWRDSGYHRGGTADIRIYVPKLHRFIGAPQVQSLIDRDPDYFGSDSELLSNCIEGQQPVTEVVLGEALEHFMECRRAELDFIESKGLPAARIELAETIEHLKALGKLELDEYGSSLQRWSNVIADEPTIT